MERKWTNIFVISAVFLLSQSHCALYQDRDKVLVQDIDVDETLEVAELELQQNKWTAVLTLWAVRDQIMTTEQAQQVSAQYFKYIDRVDSEAQENRSFSVWHLTWAISNMYRLGDDGVKNALHAAYEDAAQRVQALDRRIAKKHFNDDKIYMGFAHAGGRRYARTHLVAPGNQKYLQSVNEYIIDSASD